MCYLQIKIVKLAYFYKTKLDCGGRGQGEERPLLIQSCLSKFLMATIASKQILFGVIVII